MGKRIARAVGLSALSVAASTALASPVMYEPFDYTSGQLIVGQTNPGTGKQWLDPGSPAQPAAASDTQVILSGSLSASGLPTAGNSFSLPNTPNGNIARIELPDPNGYTYDTATSTGNAPNGLFMSMMVKVLQDTAFTTNNYFAGFHLGTGTGGMSVTNGYAGQIQLRPDPNNATNYNFGIVKNNTGGSVISWSTESIAPGQTVFLTFQYKFATAADSTDDTASIWINPDLDTLPVTPSASSSTGADGFATSGTPAVTTSILRSVYFRSNGSPATPSNLQIDEVRVGLSYADVVPEPASLSMLAVGGLALARRRRRI